MSLVSSNSLFHFTPNLHSLISILKNNFYPQYCYEIYSFKKGSLDGAIAMVCFCDLSLSQIKKHIGIYGNYGLGLTKSWGKTNGINPILYLSHNSILSDSINDILINYTTNQDKLNLSTSLGLLKFLGFIKPYEGIFKRNKKSYESFRYYDEREWRFVPDLSGIDDPLPFITKEDYNNSDSRKSANLSLRKFSLKFTPEDIKYIIINNETEILTMINSLRNIKENYSRESIDILTSKIITSKQIEDDF
ncbi:MAG: hypothetical protein KKB34_05005 [Bacteroidetes bacterium]|nr:hypothetical protein [Bacteroidota bacterium]